MNEIFKSRPKYKNCIVITIPSLLPKNTNFAIFANYQLSCFIECRQSVYKVILGLIFGSAWTKTSFDGMRKTRHMCRVKCLSGLTRKWIFRRESLFAWIRNVVRLPQGVVDIPGSDILLKQIIFVLHVVLLKGKSFWFTFSFT